MNIPYANSWSIDYSPALFSYWKETDLTGFIAWIEEMNRKYPD